MGIGLDYTNMLAESVGEDGLDADEFRRAVERAGAEAPGFLESLPAFTRLVDGDELVRRAKRSIAAKKWMKDFVVLGIGGSALGARALHAALCHPQWNSLPPKTRKGRPRFHVLDNVDPDMLAGLLDLIDPAKTVFNVVTKSGSTAETVSLFMTAKKLLGKGWKRNVVVTTDPEKGPLREVVREEGLEAFDAPPGVGGRYSVLSAAGIYPALAVGIGARKLLSGARGMLERCRSTAVKDNPALLNAALLHAMDLKGKRLHVFMPYSHALKLFSDWFAQLWAESLGKRLSVDGQAVETGPTPVKALGATDQHSQIQLYVEGPRDKVITFVVVDAFRRKARIPKGFARHEQFAYLGGRTFVQLMHAEKLGTEVALAEAGRPNETITLPRVDEESVGELVMMLELQTAFAGRLYGVNPFDQPGVEAGKVAACALLGRPGYEERRRELQGRAERLPPRVV